MEPFRVNVRKEKEKNKEQIKSKYKVEPGLHLAKLVGIVELGTVDGTKWLYASFMTEDGGFIGKRIPMYFTEHSTLSDMLYAILGNDYDEMEEIDFSQIVSEGAFCYINVQEFETSDGRKNNRITEFSYANGESFETNYRSYCFSISEAIKNIDNLPLKWLKDIIAQSDEYVAYQQMIEEKEVHFDETDRNPIEVPSDDKVEDKREVEEKQPEKTEDERQDTEQDIETNSDNIDDLGLGGVDLTEEERKKLFGK